MSYRHKRICIFIFNRATYARIKSVIWALENDDETVLNVCLAGSILDGKYGDILDHIKLEHPKTNIDCVATSPLEKGLLGMTKHSALIMHLLGEYIAEHDFDAAFVVGDRFETLPCAMALAYQNVPLIHFQGGEITGNIDERVRHAITKLSDYHYVATHLAKQYVIKMGEEHRRVRYVGCPSLDLIVRYKISRFKGLEKQVLCFFHSQTDNNDQFEETKIVLETAVAFCNKHSAWLKWYWPNPDPGREKIIDYLDEARKKYPCLVKAVNQEPFVFLKELAGCYVLIGNSSVGIREASFIGVPAVNIGGRQAIRERSWNVIDCKPDPVALERAMGICALARKYKRSFLYGRGDSAKRVLTIFRNMGKFERKTFITYPGELEFYDKHFSEKRYSQHSLKPNLIKASRSSTGSLQSEPGSTERGVSFTPQLAS